MLILKKWSNQPISLFIHLHDKNKLIWPQEYCNMREKKKSEWISLNIPLLRWIDHLTKQQSLNPTSYTPFSYKLLQINDREEEEDQWWQQRRWINYLGAKLLDGLGLEQRVKIQEEGTSPLSIYSMEFENIKFLIVPCHKCRKTDLHSLQG